MTIDTVPCGTGSWLPSFLRGRPCSFASLLFNKFAECSFHAFFKFKGLTSKKIVLCHKATKATLQIHTFLLCIRQLAAILFEGRPCSFASLLFSKFAKC